MMKTLERSSISLVAYGTAFVWIIPYLLSGVGAPDWLVSRWDLLVCLPAVVFGIVAYRYFPTFVKTPAVVLCAIFMSAGVAWSEDTERGRGALIAAAFLVTIPIAALIIKHSYLFIFLRGFAIATALSLYCAFLFGNFSHGFLIDASGSSVSNPNGVGIQAGLAALCLVIALPEGKNIRNGIYVGLTIGLAMIAIWTASRTGFIALAGSVLAAAYLRRAKARTIIIAGMALLITYTLLAASYDSNQEHFYDGIVSRLFLNDEGTLGTLGDRTEIWVVAANVFISNNTWLIGEGTGGGDKTLGSYFIGRGAEHGHDDIWRIYPHNTLVWFGLAFGVPGLIICLWVVWCAIRSAYWLDRRFAGWHRTAFTIFVSLAGTGGVLNRESIWCVVGAALWVLLSSNRPNHPSMGRGFAYRRSVRARPGELLVSQRTIRG